MPTYTDMQIRMALKAVIANRAPLSIIYPWFSLKGKPETWPGQLTSPDDLDSDNVQRVHGYVFTRVESGGDEEWTRNSRNCARLLFRYEIWGFHYWDNGREPTGAEMTAGTTPNSDMRFNKELDTVKEALNNLSLIQTDLPSEAEILYLRARPFHWDVNLKPYGNETLHFALGEIEIDPK